MNDAVEKGDVKDFIDTCIRAVSPYFKVYDYTYGEDAAVLHGVPLLDEQELRGRVYPLLLSTGFQPEIKYHLGEHILIIKKQRVREEKTERIWLNIVLAVATFFTTMMMGATMFGVDPISQPHLIYRGLPFTLAIMTVLGSHEMGHYLMAKRHGMKTSLPYFIPFPTLIGTMGAVIKHRGPIYNREALFDVGISGPLIGLIVSVLVTVIGLTLPPLNLQPAEGMMLELQLPPLFELIASSMGYTGDILHPVAFAGWVGMLITALNLIPAGQLDGGHVLRAMLGRRANYISALTPFALITLGFAVSYFLQQAGSIWLFWGLFLSFFAAAGHPPPLDDVNPLDAWRMLLGLMMFLLGALCVTLVPFRIV
jgi:membrane-associated protease RseP (regulator of RpoE activity)